MFESFADFVKRHVLDFIAVVEFFSYRADTHIRVPEWNFITALVIIHTFYKMDFIVNTDFNFANLPVR